MKEWNKLVGNSDEFNREYSKSSVELNRALVYFELLASKISISQDMESVKEFSDKLAKKRSELINGIVGVFIDACNENMWQRTVSDFNCGSDSHFEHYLSYFTPQEKTAQSGDRMVESVAFKTAEFLNEDGSAYGDEMFGHLVLPIEFVYAVNTGETDIDSWLEQVPLDGVYLKYFYDKSKNIPPIEYKITEDNVSVFDIELSPDDAVKGLMPIFESETDTEREIVKSNITEAKIVTDLLDKLAKMKLCKIKTQE